MPANLPDSVWHIPRPIPFTSTRRSTGLYDALDQEDVVGLPVVDSQIMRSGLIGPGVVKPVPSTVRFILDVLDELTEAVHTPYVH